MFGVLLMLLCVAAAIYMLVKMYKAFVWHNQGVGERNAHAEYARMRREQPDSADARLSEAEFVSQYVGARPGMARYLIGGRSEEHTSELQSLMRISYAVFCLNKKKQNSTT